ncbi:MAG: prolipoprotein diacylglyceryl transferase [Clostridia bacterium]|nr:prolipoprotein diacylglyceryl transferase [Clostridia bacterium]
MGNDTAGCISSCCLLWEGFHLTERLLFGVIPVYGLLIATGIAVAVLLCIKQEKEKGLPKDTTIDLAFWIVPLAVVCARIYYVVFQWDQYKHNPITALFVWEGGLAIYGAIIGGIIGGFIGTRRKKLPFLKIADMIVPGLILAQAIGRWGNFINGEAYGYAITNPALQFFPIAVNIHGEWHMATFFYESLWNFIGFWLLWLNRKKVRRDGNLFCCYFIWYGIGRSVIEGLRTDSLMLGPLRVSQWLSVILVIGGAVCLYLRNRQPKEAKGA